MSSWRSVRYVIDFHPQYVLLNATQIDIRIAGRRSLTPEPAGESSSAAPPEW